MRSRCLVTLAVLVVWIVVGPVATAFLNCCDRGATCERPCTVTSGIAPAASDPASPPLMASAPIRPFDRYLQTTLQVPDPPPRFLAIAA
jgi:hypothetical protein